MKTETRPNTSPLPVPRYPSLSEDFERRDRPTKDLLPLLGVSPGPPEKSVRIVYLRLLAVLAILLLAVTLMANA